MSLESYTIIESTLREGEQFVGANFTLPQKVRIASLLDAFGVEYLELTSPLASPGSLEACQVIAGLGLRARILTHVRCRLEDARVAADAGVQGIDVVIGTSPLLRRHSHGKDLEEIIEAGLEVVAFIKAQGLEARFSTEDSFRSDPEDLLRVYRAVDSIGVDRVGLADTVGVATPRQVYELVRRLRAELRADIEFHGHDDTRCAVANAFCALEAGATHVDTSVLGIGERNGITSLSGLVARLYVHDPEGLRRKYRLALLPEIDRLVAQMAGVEVPFNQPVSGIAAFTHKAGVHAKAILASPETYEALRPEDFGLNRYLHIAHRLTGWNAIRHRAEQLGLSLSDDQLKDLTRRVKVLADQKPISLSDVDALLQLAAEGSRGNAAGSPAAVEVTA